MLQREKVHQLIDHVFDMGILLQMHVIPAEATQHFKMAGKEGLLGVRVLLDHAISKLEEGEEMAEEVKGKKIKIED